MIERIPEADLIRIVAGVAAGDPDAIEALLARCTNGVRYHVARHVPAQVVNDVVHNVLVALLTQVREGKLQRPEAVFAYLRTITKAKICHEIQRQQMAKARACQHPELALTVDGKNEMLSPTREPSDDVTPEALYLAEQNRLALRAALADMRPLDREVLVRFYLREQAESEIRDAMNLTATQYRNLKCRALDRIKIILSNQSNRRRLERLAA